MIVDIFMFNDEFDMLDCRMYQLRGVVDRFIAVEGDMTLSGDKKPYRLWDARALYPDVEIIRAELSDLSGVPTQQQSWVASGYEDYWKRDWKQRNAVERAVEELGPRDVILYGDLDEIPRREAVRDFDGVKSRMMMRLFIYSTQWWDGDSGGNWTGTVIGETHDLRSFASEHRARDHNPMIADAGWHMTWFGGEDAVVAKVRMFAHGELAEDLDEVRRQYREHIAPGTATRLVPYEGQDLPAWVVDERAPSAWSA